MSKNTKGTIAAVREDNAIKLSLFFNAASSDGKEFVIESYGYVPAANPDQIDDKLCEKLIALADETVYEPISNVYAFMAGNRTLDEVKDMFRENAGQPQPKPGELGKLMEIGAGAQKGLQDFIWGLMDTMGKNFVNKTNVQFESKYHETAPKL